MNIQVQPVEAGRDAWHIARRWIAEHGRAALATVVSTWGSAPVPAGGHLVIGPDDRFEGSVSGGCVEADVLAEAVDIMASGKPKLLEYGISDDTAWRVGLPCGGTIKVLVEPLTRADLAHVDAIIDAREQRRSIVRVTRVADGERSLYREGDALSGDIAKALTSGIVGLIETPDGVAAVQPIVPPLRVIIVGATHIGQVFADMARLTGYGVTVVDPRAAFASEERFGASAIVADWPQASFDRIGLDARTAVVALTHASHIDDEAIAAALRAPCIYIGALGSRATNAKRIDRLKALGFGDDDLQRIHAPIGLNIGAKGPAEIAVSILAEIVKVSRGGS